MKPLQYFIEIHDGDEAKGLIAFMQDRRFENPFQIRKILEPVEFDKLSEVTQRVISRLRQLPC